MGDRTLFFYGTLLAPPVLHRVIYGTSSPTPLTHPAMTFLTIRPALLRGYSRHRVESADYPAIIRDFKGVVRGSVVDGLTEGDVYRLDIFEGSQYVKETVKVEVLGGGVGVYDAAPEAETEKEEGKEGGEQGEEGAEAAKAKEIVTAQTYVWCADEAYLEKQEWDFEDFKRHKMRRWMGVAEGKENSWSDDGDEAAGEWQQDGNVQVDEGFADVDEAVRELQRKEKEKEKKDPTGGRGVNGAIGKQLEEVQRNANGGAGS